MQEEIETVREHCRHEDCIYRSTIESGQTPICYYAALMHEVRGCRISECDKYVGGKPLQARMDMRYTLFWEYELYDTDADPFW